MSWRPKDWENKYKERFSWKESKDKDWGEQILQRVETIQHTAYEMGADALLTSLRKEGVDNITQEKGEFLENRFIVLLFPSGGSLVDSRKGKWVFIPED